nr:MAG TPA: hypothetical protein [Caudoviricetes sp.]
MGLYALWKVPYLCLVESKRSETTMHKRTQK